MKLRATATLANAAFPVDSDGNLMRFSYAPDAKGSKRLPEEVEFIKACKDKAVLANIEDIRNARQAPVSLEGGRVYSDDELTRIFANAAGAMHHLVARGVLVPAGNTAQQMEAAPKIGGGSTEVTEGNMDGKGNLVAPKLEDITQSDDF